MAICKRRLVVLYFILTVSFLLVLKFRDVSVTNLSWVVEKYSGNDEEFHENRTMAPSCVPGENIVYLKAHKTGSSSVQNMLMRYGVSHNLLVAVPHQYNYFGHPEPFRTRMVPPLLPSFHYSIFAHHTRFNYYELKKLMPPDSKFVTTLREPASLFESLYAYYYLTSGYNLTLEEFVSQDHKDAKSIARLSKHVIYGRIGRNQMAFDLGLDVKLFEDDDYVRKMVEELDNQFDLVMITDRMIESLVLLKHLMCWTTDDVVTFVGNAREQRSKHDLTPALRDNIIKWNRADKILYDYFSKRLDERVAAFGKERMEAEALELTNRTQQWYDYCIAGKGEKSKYSYDVHDFKLKNDGNDTCRFLALPEMTFTEEIRANQTKFRPSKTAFK